MEHRKNSESLPIIYELLNKIITDHTQVSDEINKDLKTDHKNNQESALLDKIFQKIDDIYENVERISWLNNHYRILHKFAQICSKSLNEEVLLKKAYEMVSQVMPTDSFYIATYNEGDSHFNIAFMVDNGEVYPPVTVNLGKNHTTKAIKTRKIIHHRKSIREKDYAVILGNQDSGYTNSCLFVPVIIDNQVKSVISAQCYDEFAYRKEHEELLQIIGTQVFSSIESARLYEKIYKMSLYDELTGLKNYRAFHEDLLSLMNKEQTSVHLVMIDSDRLKKVNDHYGHDIGDLYLKVLADGLKSISDETIQGYRYAGDEFMIIVNSQREIEPLYKRLTEYYTQHPIHVQSDQIVVSISAGVSVFPQNGVNVDALKKASDTALYIAKNLGGNQLVFAE
ncbi:sensor domain-containing diguanylate cyclase [Bacillus sp. BRMEA1]|uniref:sensor domain-containing diguanylate cyclase n=1 Tax=Neobacillus endophyticus TaxID=2738405 RepID=UPI001565D462|nr:sensor domain-containing diguanylate cyclase [Neobacillus endophyticus]NRD77588.1 sensor domain-containing diguanylate cyclase [Neobacillus endophyticus]